MRVAALSAASTSGVSGSTRVKEVAHVVGEIVETPAAGTPDVAGVSDRKSMRTNDVAQLCQRRRLARVVVGGIDRRKYQPICLVNYVHPDDIGVARQ